jgi:type II secretory pathway pseudopilin PulG
MKFKGRKSKGISIIEVLVAVSLLGMLIAGIQQFVFMSFNNIRLLKVEAFVKTFNLNLDAYLHSKRVCLNTLSQANPLADGKVVPSIRNDDIAPGIVVYTMPVLNLNEGNNPVSLQSISVANYVVAAGKANLNLQMTYNYNGANGVYTMTKLINVVADVDASNNVIECSTFNGLNPENLFVKVNGDEIKTGDFNVTGNMEVGVNPTDPSMIEIISDPLGLDRNMILFLSDRGLKENIMPLNRMEEVKNLNAYRFRYKGTKEWKIGFLAQEVEKVAPDAVIQNSSGQKFVSYKSLIPYVWEYHKSVYAKQLELRKRLEALEATN